MTHRKPFLLALALGFFGCFLIHSLFDWPTVWRYIPGKKIGFSTIPILKYNVVTRRVYIPERGGWVRLSGYPPLPGDGDFNPGPIPPHPLGGPN